MKFLTGDYYGANPCTSLVLQQVTRTGDKLPILFVCVWEGGDNQTIYAAKEAAESFADKMSRWFDEEALPVCIGRNEKYCVENVYRKMLSLFDFSARSKSQKKEKASDGVQGSFAVLFCAGRECLYAWRGTAQIRVLNLCFNHLHHKKLTFLTEETQIAHARLEEDVGILLGTEDFFTGLPEALLRECLAVASIENGGQAERHLREAALEAGSRGAVHPVAVLAVARGR